MTIQMSACGVICSECPAFLAGQAKDPAACERVAGAWHRLYGLDFGPDVLSCGGCLGSDEDLFFTSRKCAARRCCRSRGLASCAACADRPCADLERAQSAWDGLEERAQTLPEPVFREFVLPYCHARERVPAKPDKPAP
ncbi:MAG TPA: DUF3795 domain-containing protein [Opitutaceae bacterium]|nr:DUF3795 domain-containing protein [Opitutaceae bacterium]